MMKWLFGKSKAATITEATSSIKTPEVDRAKWRAERVLACNCGYSCDMHGEIYEEGGDCKDLSCPDGCCPRCGDWLTETKRRLRRIAVRVPDEWDEGLSFVPAWFSEKYEDQKDDAYFVALAKEEIAARYAWQQKEAGK